MTLAVFALNLLATAAVEGLLIFALFRKKEYVYYSALCNLLTNPALNLLLLLAASLFGERAYAGALAALEVAAVLAEARVYMLLCGFGAKKALGLSALLNAASFAAGLVMWRPLA